MLPLVARRYGVGVSGLDYSETGCRMARERLKHAGIEGEVLHRDLFDENEDLRGQFDFVLSFGLIEHFTEPSEVLTKIRQLLRPGGRILTTTPNVDPVSLNVWVRRRVGPKILAMHNLMTLDDLRTAHERSGFQTLRCSWEGTGLCLASDEPTLRNWIVQKGAFRAVQIFRKTCELLHISPPSGRFLGLEAVYIGNI